MNKEFIFFMKLMNGGGAERVISLLSSAFVSKGYPTILVITHQKLKDADLNNIDNRIKVISLVDEVAEYKHSSFIPGFLLFLSRVFGKFSKLLRNRDSYFSSNLKYISRNYSSIKYLREFMKEHSAATVIAFLYDSIFLSLLSKTKSNTVIVSERGDPEQTKSYTTKAFLHTIMPKADKVVFQSPDVADWYKHNLNIDGTVIFNPVKPGLPEPYFGERNKRIVNFCRIEQQKNLLLLCDAFKLFHNDFPDYELDIYGDLPGSTDESYKIKLTEHIKALRCEKYIHILPARNDIHDIIKNYSMFVSSSDSEGMSNSMLEAMAIGLPCVCTDCPAGGARAIIKDKVNGLLTPVCDAEAIYLAMVKIASDKELANKLSLNAQKIKIELSLDKIIKQWMDVING